MISGCFLCTFALCINGIHRAWVTEYNVCLLLFLLLCRLHVFFSCYSALSCLAASRMRIKFIIKGLNLECITGISRVKIDQIFGVSAPDCLSLCNLDYGAPAKIKHSLGYYSERQAAVSLLWL